MASAANSDAARLAIIRRWWAALPPKAAGLAWGGHRSVLRAQPRSDEAALVELLLHLVQALLPEVGDVQQVVLGLREQLADRVDLRPLEAVARPLGQVEVLDREVEVGRAGAGVGDLAELEALRLVAHRGDQLGQRAQRGAGRGQRLAGRDRAVGLDVEDEAVVVRRLLDAGRLDLERHPAHRREDGVDRDHADRAVLGVAVARRVAAALLDGEVDGEAALGVERGDDEVLVEDLDVGRALDVAGGDGGRRP